MIIRTIQIKLVCDICNHTWIPRTNDLPAVCPVCKRTDWNKSGKVHDLTKVEDGTVEDINDIKKFEEDYGISIDAILRQNK